MYKENYLDARARHVSFYTDNPVVIEGENAIVYLYEMASKDSYGYDNVLHGQKLYGAIAYHGKRSKVDHQYRFPTKKDAEAWANQYVSRVDEKINSELERKRENEQKRAEAAKSVKVGDIYYSSWGYDQTNVDFYMVVGKTPKTVKVVKIPTASTNISDLKSGTTYVVPAEINVSDVNADDVMVKRINKDGGFRVASYANAYKWNGQPQYETAMGWGH